MRNDQPLVDYSIDSGERWYRVDARLRSFGAALG